VLGVNENTYCSWSDVANMSYSPARLLQADSIPYQVLHFWYEANQAGLVDPDAAIMDYSAAQDKINAGRAMIVFCGMGMSANAVFTQNGQPDKGFAMIKPPSNTTQYWLDASLPGGVPGSGLAIASRCKDKVAAIKLLDYTNSWDGAELIYSGVKGKHWNLVNGIPTMEQSVLDNMKTDSNWAAQKEGIGLLTRLTCLSGGNLDPRYPAAQSVFLNFMNIPVTAIKSIDPMQVKANAFYKVENTSDLITGIPNIKYISEGPEVPYMETMPADLATIEGTTTTYVKANYSKLIYAKDDADYAAQQKAFMDGLKENGYDKVVQWYIDAQKRAFDKMNAAKG